MDILKRVIRADIETMEAYTPILPFEVLSEQLGYPPDRIIKLDANENPYGPSPRVYAALAKERFYHIYPDPESRALRAKLSEYVGVDAGMILAGSGADELIDLLMRLCLEPGDRIINCPPTFGMYSFDAGVQGGQVVNVPRLPDFSLDVAAIETAAQEPNTKIVFLTSPNNPSGNLLPDADLERLLRLPLLVALDEAYVEFAGASRVQWVARHQNLIVLRTFSKWAALAGLRVGYGVFPNALMPHLLKIKQPYNVNVAAKTAAIASLEDRDYVLANVRKIVDERARLYQALCAIPFLRPFPSSANFILCRVVGRDAHALKRSLAQQGILVRYYDSRGLSDYIRVSVGRPEHTDRLVSALKGETHANGDH